jgi:hypothetical protein
MACQIGNTHSCVTFSMATPSRYGVFHILPQIQRWEDQLETKLGFKDRYSHSPYTDEKKIKFSSYIRKFRKSALIFPFAS